MSTIPDLVAVLAGSFTPDASDAMAEVLERRVGVDSSGCFRRLAAALRAAAERWLVDNPEPQPITEERCGWRGFATTNESAEGCIRRAGHAGRHGFRDGSGEQDEP